ncbi:MAG TPA: ribulose-phosphate 3-epimerase [Firmicutes bacterium]|nr:ribulose-phosphate 3-epimerase [Bacillota bacterium]
MIQISPSILASDFANLESEIRKMENAGADMLHIDVMDGHFVPNISIGPPVIQSLRRCTHLPLDVHLMISHPLAYIGAFVKAGADMITFHLESEDDPVIVLREIRRYGLRAGMAIKPGTPAQAVFPYIRQLDMVLVMTVEPGFGGQCFMEEMLDKIRCVREVARTDNPAMRLQVDGGIQLETGAKAVAAGADCLVAGTFLFHADNPAPLIHALRALETR